jgi:hypothetical protein
MHIVDPNIISSKVMLNLPKAGKVNDVCQSTVSPFPFTITLNKIMNGKNNIANFKNPIHSLVIFDKTANRKEDMNKVNKMRGCSKRIETNITVRSHDIFMKGEHLWKGEFLNLYKRDTI